MRQRIFALSYAFVLASLPAVSSAQRTPVGPVAPPVVMHAAPIHAAPVGVTHSAAVHAAPRPSASGARPAAPSTSAPKISWNSSSAGTSRNAAPNDGVRVIVHTNGPYLKTFPPQVPDAPVLLPGDIFSGHSCYAPYNCPPVPGNGFDYTHFYATHPGWGSPILTAGVVVPFGDNGGVYSPVPYTYYSAPVPVEEEQPADDHAGNNNNAEQSNNNQNQVAAPQPARQNYYAPSYTPTDPVYEYVFVKRDGTKIFAVAYSLKKDSLQYMTKEGLLRTLSLDSLDFDATRKSNEERGNTITLPSE